MGRRPNTDARSTLSPLMFQILVALAVGERHGYAIMQEIEERSGGSFTIGAGTMYRAIKQMVDAGLMTEVPNKRSAHSQRRTYRITSAGRKRGAAEARVFDDMVAWARDTELLGSRRS